MRVKILFALGRFMARDWITNLLTMIIAGMKYRAPPNLIHCLKLMLFMNRA